MDKGCIEGRKDPELWEKAKAQAKQKLGGRHSARAMQLAGKIYRSSGGEYCDSKTKAQENLTKWTSEKWQVAPNAKSKKACREDGKCDRYLPESAWKELTPNQIKATRIKKLNAETQFVPNTKSAKNAAIKARMSLPTSLGKQLDE